MSSRYHGPLRWMSNFKAVQADYAYYLKLSDEPESVCLSERQRYLITVQNTYTYWATRWYNTDDVSEAELQTIAAEIEDLMMCGCGVPEPSITDRFNTNNWISETSEVYETTYNTWNDAGQTIVSIAPNLDIDTGDPVDINKLFCLAFKMLVVSLTQTAIGVSNQSAAGKRDIVKATGAALAGLSAAGGIAASIGGGGVLLAALTGPWTLLGLAIAGIAVGVSSLFVQADNSAMEDEDAINAVANLMYCNTKDRAMTQDVFAGALTPNTFEEGSHEEKILNVVLPFIQDVTVYLQFLVIMNQYYDAVDFGVMPECDDCPEEHILDIVAYDFGGLANICTFLEHDDDGYEVWDIELAYDIFSPYLTYSIHDSLARCYILHSIDGTTFEASSIDCAGTYHPSSPTHVMPWSYNVLAGRSYADVHIQIHVSPDF